MPKLPSLTARKVVGALKRAGFVEDRQRGSHLVLVRPKTQTRTVVPMHAGKTIKPRLLFAIIRDSQLTVDQFLELI
jgi:predicted RNA binding protein YcfA (HicA-like mRNA interferase family)